MSRKGGRPPSLPLSVDPRYWENFLRSKGIITDLEPAAPPGEEVKVPPDPQFAQFLREASRWGAPKTVAEFKNLDVKQRQYFLKAYAIYLEEMKKMRKETRSRSSPSPSVQS